MKSFKLILKESGLSGLKLKQWLFVVWFCISLFGLTMNENAPYEAWVVVWTSVIASGYFCAKYVKLTIRED